MMDGGRQMSARSTNTAHVVRPSETPEGIGRIELIVVATGDGRSQALDGPLDELRAMSVPVMELLGHGGPGLARAVTAAWQRSGIRPAEILYVDGCDGACRTPEGIVRILPTGATSALAAIARRRAAGELPAVPDDPRWTIDVVGAEPGLERVRDSWLTIADGLVGSVGSPLTGYEPARREVIAANAYIGDGPSTDLLRLPDWTRLTGALSAEQPIRRVLDLRTGLLHHVATSTAGWFQAVTLASRAMPGVGVLRAVGPGARADRRGPLASIQGTRGAVAGVGRAGSDPDVATGRLQGNPAGVAFAAIDRAVRGPSGRHLERLAAYRIDPTRPATIASASRLLGRARARGVDGLLADQRSAWARRWHEMDIRIEGDERLQRAVRFSLFHLDSSIATQREAPLGPRGLTGPGYKGHVFWDSEIFVLPFFAATRPSAARAMLEYRVRRLAAAQAAASEAGLRGAWFPWESAASGRDVTPRVVPGPDGQPIYIWTGLRELHVISDIAWAAVRYAAWSGDQGFLDGDGRRLLVETARFWASRLERDPDGSAHVRGIIGPDEYHEFVDDNAYTNVMARWNLRTAAAAVRRGEGRAPAASARTGGLDGGGADDVSPAEVDDWLTVADQIVDGFDPATGVYEQFAGFHALEDVRIAALTRRPVWGDVFLGRERTEQAQVVKQTDVLMLHHLVPDEVAPGTLEANLDYYEPRTAHGSSLSPGTHAELLARAGRFDAALEALDMTAYLDLDDRTGTAAEGLHIPTMGGLWQALATGFAGIRPVEDGLAIDPRLPPSWSLLEVPVRYRGRLVRTTVEHGRLTIRASAPVTVIVPGIGRLEVGRSGVRLAAGPDGWHDRG